jgi:serine/threonine-protein kinase RsbW
LPSRPMQMTGPLYGGTVLRIGSAVEELAQVYPWLDAAAQTVGAPVGLLPGMHVVLDEAVMNAVMHGGAASIVLTLTVEPGVVVLTVEDDGAPFDPLTATPREKATRLEEASPGGLGLRLMHHYCQDMAYQRTGGMNRLMLRFPVA